MDTLAIVIAILLVLAGIVLLQITLSKSSNKWLGLIIPLICFLCSLIVVFFYIVNTVMSNGMFAAVMITLFITNIPTLLLLAIYFYCRNNIKKNKELEKMNIQDLE